MLSRIWIEYTNKFFYSIMPEGTRPALRFQKGPGRYVIRTILVAFIAVVIWQLQRSAGTTESRNTIVVLPLTLINPDTANQYLVQGITDELIRSPGKVRALDVINPRSTSIRYMASLNLINEELMEK